MRWTLPYFYSNLDVQINYHQDKKVKCSNWAGLPSLIFLIWPVSITDPSQYERGSSSIKSRNPNTPEKPTNNHHCYSRILLLSLSLSVIFFPFWVFHVNSVYLWLFSVIWVYTLYYFGAWIQSLRIYPQHLVFSLRSWILTHDLSLIQHPVAPTDLHFKLNKMRSKVTVSYKDPESVQADSSRKCTIGHRAPTSKEDAPTTTMKTEDSMTFTPLKLSIDQIFNIIKHQP